MVIAEHIASKIFYGLFTGCINTIAGINCIYAGEGCWYFESEDKKYSLVIPNKEIKEVFKLHIQEWFRNKIFSNRPVAGLLEGFQRWKGKLLS